MSYRFQAASRCYGRR